MKLLDAKKMPWQQVAALVVERLGCLVLRSERPLQIGQIVNKLNVRATADRDSDQPMRVMSEATREDWVRQLHVYGGKVSEMPRHAYYYFVETD